MATLILPQKGRKEGEKGRKKRKEKRRDREIGPIYTYGSLFGAPSLTVPTRAAARNLRTASVYLSSESRFRDAVLLGLALVCLTRYPNPLLLFGTSPPPVFPPYASTTSCLQYPNLPGPCGALFGDAPGFVRPSRTTSTRNYPPTSIPPRGTVLWSCGHLGAGSASPR